MPNPYDENRQKLAVLMYSLGKFTKMQLIRAFSKTNKGDIRIAGYQNVGSLIDEMTEYGDLKREGNTYQLVPVGAL